MQVVHEPEVVNENRPVPFDEAGRFPALHNSLKESLGDSLKECEDLAEEMAKIGRAQVELYKRALKEKQRAYRKMRDDLSDLGV